MIFTDNDLLSELILTDGKTVLVLVGVWDGALQTGRNTLTMPYKLVLVLVLVTGTRMYLYLYVLVLVLVLVTRTNTVIMNTRLILIYRCIIQRHSLLLAQFST